MQKSKYILFVTIICLLSVALNAQNASYSNDSKNKDAAIKEIKQCLKGKIKYPFFMQLYKLEGRVFVILHIDNYGKINKISTETDYFGKIYSLEHFKSKSRTERLRQKIEKRMIPLFAECTQNLSFEKPLNDSDRFIKVPVSFGTYSDLDDYGISDDYDDYDYEEEFDYHYFDYD